MQGQLSLIAVQPNYPWRRWGICGIFLLRQETWSSFRFGLDGL